MLRSSLACAYLCNLAAAWVTSADIAFLVSSDVRRFFLDDVAGVLQDLQRTSRLSNSNEKRMIVVNSFAGKLHGFRVLAGWGGTDAARQHQSQLSIGTLIHSPLRDAAWVSAQSQDKHSRCGVTISCCLAPSDKQATPALPTIVRGNPTECLGF
eukprot:3355694-Amphidinium_carterae.2